jgi:hypothetical protein
MPNEKQKRRAKKLLACAALAAVTIATAGCVVDPYPPAGAAYYPGPYSYYDYPPYYGSAYYGAYGPPVGVAVGFGEPGWRGGRGWR